MVPCLLFTFSASDDHNAGQEAAAGWPECYPDLRNQTLALLQAAIWWPAGIEILEYCCPGRLLQLLVGCKVEAEGGRLKQKEVVLK